ncbi:MAG: rod shape-determining protein MreD [Lachnospiraceae bacterium]|nr:rod shape-determining protein MreD [Lachnospiraceae bacterium]
MGNRRGYRYALYVLEIFVLYLIEGTPHLLPEFYLAKPLLVVPVAVCIAAFESPQCAIGFGIFCGIVIDIGTGGAVGLTSVILVLVCCLESYLNSKYLKENIYMVLIYSAVASAAVVSLKFFVFYIMRRYPDALNGYVTHYLPRIVYTWAVTPFVYLLTVLVSKTFIKDKKKIKVKSRKRSVQSQRSSASRRRAKMQDVL